MNIKEKNRRLIEWYVDNLNLWTKAYDEGRPTISDEVWDKNYFELVRLEAETGIYLSDSPTQRINYSVVNNLKKVTHNHPMLSLQKTQSINEINSFIGNKNCAIMLKLDGLTCSLGYENGQLISAETRGDGEIGEDILHNALVVKNIPKKIKYKGKLTIDGEIICKNHYFEKFINEYKNPRNFAAGSIRLLDSKECAKRNLSFIAWDLFDEQDDYFDTLTEKLMCLADLGFEIPNFTKSETIEFNSDLVNKLRTKAEEDGIPIDGLVIKYNDCKYYQSLGRTDHHFRGGIAFKFYDEIYETNLVDIEWTMGRTGVLTPVAVFDPIEIDGCTVTRASMHNVSVMEELMGKFGPYLGQKLEVFKANQIIPQIKSADQSEHGTLFFIEHPNIEYPTKCPICGGVTEIHGSISGTQEMLCMNPQCEGKLINKLNHFCGKKGLDIKGLSKATLEKLIDWGWVKSFKDIFSLDRYEEEWIKKPGFGAKSVRNILNAIQKGRTCKLNNYIAALGIPLIGATAAKDITTNFLTWSDFISAINNKYEFYNLSNFGIEMHKSLLNFDYTEAIEIANNFIIFDIENNTTETEKKLENISIVITGKLNHYKNRDKLKSVIEDLGGKVTGTISSKTSYLINNDVNSTSSKNVTAKKLNIPIISEEEFIQTFGL